METQERLRRIDPARLTAFQAELLRKEYSVGTAENYLRAVRAFARWSGGAVERGLVLTWKAQLTAQYAPATVNAMLAGLNRFFDFAGRPECRVKVLRLQRRSFREAERELDREEYRTLVRTARTLGRERLALVMETICATGIRVGEVPYITVEALRRGKAVVALKGKVRTILLPEKLCKKLLKYVKRQKITSGEVFLTGGGKRLSRVQIWAEMKRLCRAAGVAAREQLYYSNQPGRAQPYFSLFVEFARKQRGNLADLFCDSVNRRNGYWNGSCFSNKKRRKRVFRTKAGGGFVAA